MNNMEPSDRIFFDGHYHKDVFFNGHYHKEAWLNGKCVWRKSKGQLISYISMVSYVGGKYYLVAESSRATTDFGYPILYEGISLSKLKKKGLIFGDNQVRGRYYIMHTYLDKIVIIRTRNILEKYIAVIPVINGSADMNNIKYELDTYEYSGYTPYQSSEYVYRKGNYYSCKYDGGWRFFKNDVKISNTYFRDICINNNKLIAIGGFSRYGAGSNIPALQFGIFNDESDTIDLKEISLNPIIENLRDTKREETINSLKESINKYKYISDSIESVEAICDEGEKFNNYFRSSDNKWYRTVKVFLKVKFKGIYEDRPEHVTSITNDINYNAIYRIAVNFDSFTLESFSKIDYDRETYILSQLILPQICVQTIRNGVDPARLNWGLPDKDYVDVNSPTSYSGGYEIPDLNDITISSVAARENELIVGISTSRIDLGNFFVIDTESKTAYYKTIEAYEE